jgi:hypothetical protein
MDWSSRSEWSRTVAAPETQITGVVGAALTVGTRT